MGQQQGLIAAKEGLLTGQLVTPRGVQYVYPPVIPGVSGEIIRGSSRGIAAIHSYGETVAYFQQLYSMAYRDASNAGLSEGSPAFNARVANFVNNPTLAAMDEANNIAKRQVFLGEGGSIMQALGPFSQTRIGQALVPFMRIDGNLLRSAIMDRTPLGLLGNEVRANLSGKNGANAQHQQIAKMLYGGAVVGSGVWLFHEGLITGPPPSDPDHPERNARMAQVWRDKGYQPDSFRLVNTWIPNRYIPIAGPIFNMLASGLQGAADMKPDTQASWTGHVLMSVANGVLESTWLRTFSDLFQAMHQGGEHWSRWMNNYIANYLPFSAALNQAARLIDPEMREANGLIETVQNKIPIASEWLYPRRGIWGQPVAPAGATGMLYGSPLRHDPVDEALVRAGVYPALPQQTIRNVRLDEAEYDKLSEFVGTKTRMRLERIVAMPRFQNLTPGLQARALQKVWEGKYGTHEMGIKMMQQDNWQKFVIDPKMQKVGKLFAPAPETGEEP
jgi:hypothetical protein